MSEQAGNNGDGQGANNAVQRARIEERLDGVQNAISQVFNTANLGTRWVSNLIALFSILVALVFLALGAVFTQQFRQLEAIAENKHLIETQKADMLQNFKQQALTIDELGEQVETLTASLGDIPQMMRDTAASIEGSRTSLAQTHEDFAALLSDFDARVAAFKGVELSLRPLATDVRALKKGQQGIVKLTGMLGDPKGKFRRQIDAIHDGVLQVSDPEGTVWQSISVIKQDTSILKKFLVEE